MIRFPLRLSRDERGATIVELALAVPFFAALLIGIVDLSRAYSMKLKLEQSAQRAIEKIEQQHTVQPSYTSYATEAATAATAAGYTGSTATSDYWLECNGVRQSASTAACSNSTDTYARYVTISVSNSYTPFFPSRAWPGADAQGNIPLSGTAGIRVQ